MPNTHTISVVIPTCHRNDLLAKCLDCLGPGAQTLSADQYEVIVTDDGAQSTAEQMVREHYPWAHWVAGPRQGPAANRNNGAKFAQGEWLAFTDDDCLPEPDWLSAYSDATASGHSAYEGKTTCREGIKSPLYDAPINLDGGRLWSCNIMLRRSTFNKLEGFDTDFAFYMEDADFRDRLKLAADNSVFVENAVVDHPPMKRRGGLDASRGWEAHIQTWYKNAEPQPSRFLLLIHILKVRIRYLIRFSVTKDTFQAIFAVMLELWIVFNKYHEWHTRYAGFYAKHQKALTKVGV